jgi:hypothetical protein
MAGNSTKNDEQHKSEIEIAAMVKADSSRFSF